MRTTTKDVGSLRFMQLDVYRVAREVVVAVGRLGLKDAELRSQVTRAAASLLLNLSEGLPSRQAGLRARYFTTARGSAYEVAAAVDVAAALGLVGEQPAAQIMELCDRVSAMLYRMR